MTEAQSNPEDKKVLFKNDRMLVCGMFAFYGICILSLIIATFLWLDRRAKAISANTTSTAVVVATEQANAAATSAAHATELAKYDFIDHFDNNNNRIWLTGPQNDDYWVGKITIEGGVYLWEVLEVKKTFIEWAEFPRVQTPKDFDVYVDTKFLESKSKQVCSGIIFRKSIYGWKYGEYLFTICNNSFFYVSYQDEKGWQNISKWQYDSKIQPANWNRIEISAQGNHFKFWINNEMVYEMSDDRLKEGNLALFIELSDKNPAKVEFDNFGYQRR